MQVRLGYITPIYASLSKVHMTQLNQSQVSEIKKNTTTKKTLFDHIASYNFIYLCSFYIYFSGALYFYGYMGEIGFSGASLDSIFSPLIYSQVFLGEVFNKALLANLSVLLLFPLEVSLIATSIFVLFAIAFKYKVLKSFFSKVNKLCCKKNEKTLLERNPVISALLTFPIVYFGHLASFMAVVLLSAVVVVPLYFPYKVGSLSAQAFVTTDDGKVCKNISWDLPKYQDQKIVLSCETIPLNIPQGQVSGVIIHSDSKYMYMVTNNFLLRVKDGNVASCISKQVNPSRAKSGTLEQRYISGHKVSPTCEGLLSSKKGK